MPANIGNQTISIIYFAPGQSSIVNRRHKSIRTLGIYSGGYVSFVPGINNVNLSPLICEITDGTHQVRVQTESSVNIAVASGYYVVLRWSYGGSISDYMEILAVATPATNDVVIGKCIFTGSPPTLQGFDYSERTTPNTMNLFLRVEASDASMTNKMKVRVRAGRICTTTGVVKISDLETPSPFTHSGGGLTEYGLVYIDVAGVVQIVDANGNTSIPSFGGKLVLAIVAITATTTVITQSMITDVRGFLSKPIGVDNSTIEFDSTTGKLKVKAISGSQIGALFGSRTNKDSLGSTLAVNNVYKVTSDGFILISSTIDGFKNIAFYSDSSNPPSILLGKEREAWDYAKCYPVTKDEYWKAHLTEGQAGWFTIFWKPIGIGQCVKQ